MATGEFVLVMVSVLAWPIAIVACALIIKREMDK